MKDYIKNLLKKIKFFFAFSFTKGVKLNINYPTSWEAMSMEEFQNVCTLLSLPVSCEEEMLHNCLCALGHLRPTSVLQYDPQLIKDNGAYIYAGQIYFISPETIREACDQLKYITNETGLSPSPIGHLDRKLYGVTFGQFYEADAMMLRYQATGQEKFIVRAARVLTSGKVKGLKVWQVKGMTIWWGGVKKYLMTKYPYVFQDGGDGSSFGDKTPADILQDLMLTMNGNKPQDNDKILKTDVHSVLSALNNIYYQNAHK